jgi:hypothetical protein
LGLTTAVLNWEVSKWIEMTHLGLSRECGGVLNGEVSFWQKCLLREIPL